MCGLVMFEMEVTSRTWEIGPARRYLGCMHIAVLLLSALIVFRSMSVHINFGSLTVGLLIC